MVLEAQSSSLIQSVVADERSDLDICFEQIIAWAEKTYGKSFFADRIPEFYEKFGKIFPEDAFFGERMNYFLERTVFETKDTDGATVFETFLQSNKQNFINGLNILSAWSHGLFLITKIAEHSFVARNLFTGKDVTFKPRSKETFKYLQKKTIFQGFVFSDQDSFFLGQGIILHSPRVTRFLVKACKKLVKAKDFSQVEVLELLARRHLKSLRMAHVHPTVLYQDIFV